jgi:hypothetical protein
MHGGHSKKNGRNDTLPAPGWLTATLGSMPPAPARGMPSPTRRGVFRGRATSRSGTGALSASGRLLSADRDQTAALPPAPPAAGAWRLASIKFICAPHAVQPLLTLALNPSSDSTLSFPSAVF